MGLEIITLEQQAAREKNEPVKALVADRRLFLDETQQRVVEEGHRDAHWQLAAPGHRIQASEVARLGLSMHDGRVIQGEPAEKEPAAETEEEKSRTPTEKKPRTPDEKKPRTPAEKK